MLAKALYIFVEGLSADKYNLSHIGINRPTFNGCCFCWSKKKV